MRVAILNRGLHTDPVTQAGEQRPIPAFPARAGRSPRLATTNVAAAIVRHVEGPLGSRR